MSLLYWFNNSLTEMVNRPPDKGGRPPIGGLGGLFQKSENRKSVIRKKSENIF